MVRDTYRRIRVEGRLTSEGAKNLEKEIEAVQSPGNLELDFSRVSYISSEGIRLLLKLTAQGRKIRLFDVNAEVYDVLESSRITDLLEAKRPLKKVSLEGLKWIGEGASATVYDLDDDRVIKVFHPDISDAFVYMEDEISRQVFLSGIDTMVTYEVVSTDRGKGIIYEKLRSRNMHDCMVEDHSQLVDMVKAFANFVLESHKTHLNRGLFGQASDPITVTLRQYELLGISKEESDVLVDVVNSLVAPTDEFCHADCHMGNVMIKADGGLQFIDVGRVSCGHMIFDTLSMFLQYRYHGYRGIMNPQEVSRFARPFSPEERQLIWDTYFDAVTGIQDAEQKRIAEEQVNVMSGIYLLTTKVMRDAGYLSGDIAREFVNNALRYAESGGGRVVF